MCDTCDDAMMRSLDVSYREYVFGAYGVSYSRAVWPIVRKEIKGMIEDWALCEVGCILLLLFKVASHQFPGNAH